MTDVASRSDIETLLRTFYSRVLIDDMLSEPFSEVREAGLESHLPVMCDFWETSLLNARSYRGNALVVHHRVHVQHSLTGEHFVRWLTLWVATVDELHAGPVSERAKRLASRIAWAMHRRLTGADTDELQRTLKGIAGTVH